MVWLFKLLFIYFQNQLFLTLKLWQHCFLQHAHTYMCMDTSTLTYLLSLTHSLTHSPSLAVTTTCQSWVSRLLLSPDHGQCSCCLAVAVAACCLLPSACCALLTLTARPKAKSVGAKLKLNCVGSVVCFCLLINSYFWNRDTHTQIVALCVCVCVFVSFCFVYILSYVFNCYCVQQPVNQSAYRPKQPMNQATQ